MVIPCKNGKTVDINNIKFTIQHAKEDDSINVSRLYFYITLSVRGNAKSINHRKICHHSNSVSYIVVTSIKNTHVKKIKVTNWNNGAISLDSKVNKCNFFFQSSCFFSRIAITYNTEERFSAKILSSISGSGNKRTERNYLLFCLVLRDVFLFLLVLHATQIRSQANLFDTLIVTK